MRGYKVLIPARNLFRLRELGSLRSILRAIGIHYTNFLHLAFDMPGSMGTSILDVLEILYEINEFVISEG